MATYKSVVLAARPKAEIIPGTFKTIEKPVLTEADLKDGQILLKTRYLSLDPAMRGWLNDTRSYIPPVPINGIMRGGALSQVIASKSQKYSVGEHVYAVTGWTELAICDDSSRDLQSVENILRNGGENARLTDALGVLGTTGLTAYFGLLHVGHIKAGDFVVVSGAAGATGSVVCQIAKLKGATVLGIAGSDEKVKWLKELGCDYAVNYKDKDFKAKFKALTKDHIDVFFDNVGGEILDAALSRAKPHSRFVICGAISQYNSANPQGPKNFSNVISMRIRVEGFIVFDYINEYPTALRELSQWLAEGKIQRKETIVEGGLGVAEEALRGLYHGVNTGKLIVEVSKADEAVGKAKL